MGCGYRYHALTIGRIGGLAKPVSSEVPGELQIRASTINAAKDRQPISSSGVIVSWFSQKWRAWNLTSAGILPTARIGFSNGLRIFPYLVDGLRLSAFTLALTTSFSE